MSEEKTPRLCFDTYVGKNKHLKAEKRPFSSFPLHAHSFFELEIVVSGRGTQEINGKVYPIGRGSVYLLTPSAFHKVTVDGENPTLINVSFDETAASVRLPIGESYLCRTLSDKEFAAVTNACELLLNESDQSAASLLLSYVIKKVCGECAERKSRRSDSESRRARGVSVSREAHRRGRRRGRVPFARVFRRAF